MAYTVVYDIGQRDDRPAHVFLIQNTFITQHEVKTTRGERVLQCSSAFSEIIN